MGLEIINRLLRGNVWYVSRDVIDAVQELAWDRNDEIIKRREVEQQLKAVDEERLAWEQYADSVDDDRDEVAGQLDEACQELNVTRDLLDEATEELDAHSAASLQVEKMCDAIDRGIQALADNYEKQHKMLEEYKAKYADLQDKYADSLDELDDARDEVSALEDRNESLEVLHDAVLAAVGQVEGVDEVYYDDDDEDYSL